MAKHTILARHNAALKRQAEAQGKTYVPFDPKGGVGQQGSKWMALHGYDQMDANQISKLSPGLQKRIRQVQERGGLVPKGKKTSSSKHNYTAGKGGGAVTKATFPIDVVTDAGQGHYILFHIKDWDSAGSKLSASKAGNLKSGSGLAGGPNSLTLNNMPKTKLVSSIALYMPPQIQASYGMKYADKEIGLTAHGSAAAIQAFRQASGFKGTFKAMGGAFMDIGEVAAKEWFLKGMDALIPGMGAVEALTSGTVITPHMELMFEGVGRREFSFSFVMIPRSSKEAEQINIIVDQFKMYMHPEYTMKSFWTQTEHHDGLGGLETDTTKIKTRAMTFPAVFEIEYRYRGVQNSHLHKISTSYLTKMDVSHGGDRYMAYEGGQPQKTMLTLNFTEIEIMTRSHMAAGY